MDVPKEFQEVCSSLERYRVPAAVGDDFEDRLVAWNASFTRVVERPVETLGTLRTSETLVRVAPPARVQTEAPAPSVLFLTAGGEKLSGRAFRGDPRYRLFLLDVPAFDAATDDYVRGVLVGQERTHDHLKQSFHDTVSQQVMAATFAVEMLRGKLEDHGAENAREVEAISGLLQSLFTEIQVALNSDLTVQSLGHGPFTLTTRQT